MADRGGTPHAWLGARSERELEGALLALLCSLTEGEAKHGGGLERVVLVRCAPRVEAGAESHPRPPTSTPNLDHSLEPQH